MIGIISYEKYKQRAIFQAKGYQVPHPEIKIYHTKLPEGYEGEWVDLNKLPVMKEL